MNTEKFMVQRMQLRERVKMHWRKLTEDDLIATDANSESLIGKLQERYGIGRAEARQQIREFDKRI